VKIEPRGTALWCSGCRSAVTPPAVLAPYERGPVSVRQVASRRERDDDAKRTALLAGEFLRRVAALLADPKIHPASADLLGWYQEEITEARKGRNSARLAELADEFDADSEARAFRRVHWWQGEPAALGAVVDDEDPEDDYDDDGQDDEPARPRPLPAAVADSMPDRPGRMSWAAAVLACGWQLNADADGCQIVDSGLRCTMPGARQLGRIRACVHHQSSMSRVIDYHHQQKGATA
jgi:hypothetical protein